MKLLTSLGLLLSLALPAAASPETDADAAAPGAASPSARRDADCARARRAGQPCVLTFSTGDDIDGTVRGPDGSDVSTGEPMTFGSLLRLRTTFVPELVRAVEAL